MVKDMANSFNTDAEKETDVKQQEGTPPTPTPKSNDNYGLYVLLVAMIGIVIWLLNSAPETLKDSINQQPPIVEKKDTSAYVDLGLPSGTLWATCNVGANNPWEYGCYFAWGEIKPKNGAYSDTTYTYYDNPETLPPSHDAATQNWGSDWCMPTIQQLKELIDKCTWTWTSLSGKNGYEIMGKNGNSIFLPAAGRIYFSLKRDGGVLGFYWSSSLWENNSDGAWYLNINMGVPHTIAACPDRFYGYSVPPVPLK